MTSLRELHLQGNRLTVLPPSLGSLDFLSSRSILKLDKNPWVPPIEDQLMLGVSHVIEFIRTGEDDLCTHMNDNFLTSIFIFQMA